MKTELRADEKHAAKQKRYSHLVGIIISTALGILAGIWLAEKFALESIG